MKALFPRRTVLAGGLSALAAGAASANPARTIIDVHHHFLPPEYVARRRKAVASVWASRLETLDHTPQWSLDHLEQSGARTAMLSLSAPGVWFGDRDEARILARIANDYGASWVRSHPTRFGLLGTLPWPDVEGTLREIEYASDTLKADGFSIMATYGGRYPGEPEFEPIWRELHRRRAVVYVHPNNADCCRTAIPGLTPPVIEFPQETTRAIASLLLGMVFTRYPGVRFIFSHGGGTLPMIATRFAGAVQMLPASRENAKLMEGGPMGELRRLHFDTASVVNPISWSALTRFAPMTQILFGTDYPFGEIPQTAAALKALGLTASDYEQVTHGNALSLFPRLRAQSS